LKNKKLYFIHGWGFDSKFWKPLLKILNSEIGDRFEIITFDLGFYYNPHYPSINKSQGKKNFFITHSFGYNWLLKNINSFDGLINFCGSANYFSKKNNIRKSINKMIKMFELDPSYVLNDFFKNSGVEFQKPNKSINNKLLIESLHILRDEDLTKIEYKNEAPQQNIFCKDDKIIKIKDLDKLDVDLVVDGDHGFPYKLPVKAKNIILNFLKLNNEL
tara:strand:- start:443 stop:1093 length:651 start_codon:yes stop_codon:yes gene_type:complete